MLITLFSVPVLRCLVYYSLLDHSVVVGSTITIKNKNTSDFLTLASKNSYHNGNEEENRKKYNTIFTDPKSAVLNSYTTYTPINVKPLCSKEHKNNIGANGKNLKDLKQSESEVSQVNINNKKKRELIKPAIPNKYLSESEFPSNNGGKFMFNVQRRVSQTIRNPYSVALIIKTAKGTGSCTGSLLNALWVLTAASCFKHASVYEVVVYAGGNSILEYMNNELAKGSQVRKGVIIYIHHKYRVSADQKTFHNIAVFRVDKKFHLSKTVAPVQLSTKPWSHGEGVRCQITSFGGSHQSPNIQVYEGVPTVVSVDYARTTQYFHVETPCLCLNQENDTDYWVCAKSAKNLVVCTGDIGAGLVCGDKLEAVTSSIMTVRDLDSCDLSSGPNARCGGNDTLNVFQGICPYLWFINKYAGLFDKKKIPRSCDYKPPPEKEPEPSQVFTAGAKENHPTFPAALLLASIVNRIHTLL